jgi:predicted aspartyl protease
MIRGVVTQRREAVIKLRVHGPACDHDIEAVIDTGFNDFLSLPHSLISALDLPYETPLLATLANGKVAELDSYRGTVQWDDKARDILVVECEGGALVGMSLLYGYDLHIEAVDDGVVTITKRD